MHGHTAKARSSGQTLTCTKTEMKLIDLTGRRFGQRVVLRIGDIGIGNAIGGAVAKGAARKSKSQGLTCEKGSQRLARSAEKEDHRASKRNERGLRGFYGADVPSWNGFTVRWLH